MQTLISILRAVNMAGHNRIKMSGLADLYGSLGLNDAETFIQSGNVIFNDPDDRHPPEIEHDIYAGIKERFGLDISIMVRTVREMKEIISNNPFTGDNIDTSKLAVIFLAERPSDLQMDKVRNIDYPPDKFSIIGKEIFIYCPNGFGRTRIYTGFFESKMKVTGTGRNWNSVNTLLEIAERKESVYN